MEGYGKVHVRMTKMEDWLRETCPEVFSDQKHLDEGSIERAYWHYGYMVALQDILQLQIPKSTSRIQ